MDVSVAICCQVHLYAEGICKLLEEDDEINVLGVSAENDGLEELDRHASRCHRGRPGKLQKSY